jgi:hypothetical protein
MFVCVLLCYLPILFSNILSSLVVQLKIWRNIDSTTDSFHPGMVDSSAVRKKLSKQLKIDLESFERVHLYKEPVSYGDYNEKATEELMGTLGDSEVKCEVQIKKVGDYIARITLRGGYSVPLRFEVTKR